MKDVMNDSAEDMDNRLLAADVMTSIENVIIQFLDNEKRLVGQIYALLHEQLSLFDIGKNPDLQLIHETICFMEDYPELINHPIKLDIIHTITRSTSEENVQMDDLLAEKSLLETQRSLVKHHIESLFTESTVIKKEQFRIFCKDYLEVFENHFETEGALLPIGIKSSLNAEDQLTLRDRISSIDTGAIHVDENKYPDLFGQIELDINAINSTASKLAINDSINMGNIMRHIELISEGSTEISHIIKEFIYKLYLENYQCYRELLLHSQKKKLDYIHKPLLCFRVCYDDYVNRLNQITGILRERKNGTIRKKK